MPRLTCVCILICGSLSLSSVSNSQQLPAGSVPTKHHLSHGRFRGTVDLSKLKSGGGIRTLDTGGSFDSITHDAQGRVTKVLEPDATGQFTIETDYTYDVLGHVTQITQKGGTDDAPRVRSFTYDSNGNLLSVSSPEAGTTTYTRDSHGNIASKTDARGNTITYSYDSRNRLTGKQYSDGSPHAVYDYSFQDHSKRYYLETKEEHRYERIYHYDAEGGLDQIAQSYPLKQGNSTYTIGLSYDGKKRLAGITYPDGRSVTQQWSARDRLLSIGDRGVTYFSGATYWPSGYLHTATLGNGVTIDKDYNGEQKLQSLVAKSGDETVLNKNYLYNDSGSILKVEDGIDSDNNLSYKYDLLNRISQATQVNGDFSQNFQYDAFGNLSIVGDSSVAHKFDSDNRFDGSSGLTYDEIGEMTFDGTHRYAYNADGLIASVDDGAVQYAYDAEGYRVQKIVGESVSDYVWLDGLLLAEHLPDGGWTDYIYANGQRIASITTPGKNVDGKPALPVVTYFLADPQGTVRMALSGNGTVVTKGDFAPFGAEITKASQSSAASISFSDEVHDEETGLDAYMYRSYNPKLGRWMSPDPSGERYANPGNPQSLDLYSYVINDPLKYIDADGLVVTCDDESYYIVDPNTGDMQVYETEYCDDNGGGGSGGGGGGGGSSGGGAGGGGGSSPWPPNPNLHPCPTSVNAPPNVAPVSSDPSRIAPPPAVPGRLTISTTMSNSSYGVSSMIDGHAWLTFTTDSGVTYTYGTWGNSYGLQHVHGVNENTEIAFAPTSSLTAHITATQAGALSGYIASMIAKGADAWTIATPCTSFATAGWSFGTGQFIDPLQAGLVDNPANLQKAINIANGGQGCS